MEKEAKRRYIYKSEDMDANLNSTGKPTPGVATPIHVIQPRDATYCAGAIGMTFKTCLKNRRHSSDFNMASVTKLQNRRQLSRHAQETPHLTKCARTTFNIMLENRRQASRRSSSRRPTDHIWHR